MAIYLYSHSLIIFTQHFLFLFFETMFKFLRRETVFCVLAYKMTEKELLLLLLIHTRNKINLTRIFLEIVAIHLDVHSRVSSIFFCFLDWRLSDVYFEEKRHIDFSVSFTHHRVQQWKRSCWCMQSPERQEVRLERWHVHL